MRRRFIFICLALAVLVWPAYALLARPVSTFLSLRWGAGLLQAGDGKFAHPAAFLQNRFLEATLLVSLGCLLVILVSLAGAGLAGLTLSARQRKSGAQAGQHDGLSPLWRWIPYSVAGFIGLNLWLKLAMSTCLFWCLFWNGKAATNNLTQFQIKLLLMNENPAPYKVVLGGSSQTRAQIDVRQLNRQLGSNIFTTELHFPGNRGYDYLFLDRKLQGHKTDAIVCYLSEMTFYGGGLSDGFSLFFGWRALPEFLRLGGQLGWSAQSLGYGLLGDILPLFRVREPCAERLLGHGVIGLSEQQPSGDLEQRAAQAAAVHHVSPQSEFHERAFEHFVDRCHSEGRKVVLCCGQYNPVLARHLDPGLRPQMLAFIHQLAQKYDNVLVLEEKDLPPQTEPDYEDLTHVNPAAQARFTEVIAQTLQQLAGTLRAR